MAMQTHGEVQGVSQMARDVQAMAQQAAQTTSKYEKELVEVMHEMK